MENKYVSKAHEEAIAKIHREVDSYSEEIKNIKDNESVKESVQYLIETLNLLPEWAVEFLIASRRWLRIDDNRGYIPYRGDIIFNVSWYTDIFYNHADRYKVAHFVLFGSHWEGYTLGRNEETRNQFDHFGSQINPERLVECILPALEDYKLYGNAVISAYLANDDYLGFSESYLSPDFNYGVVEFPRFDGEYKKRDIYKFRRMNERIFEMEAVVFPRNIKKGTYPFGRFSVDIEKDAIHDYEHVDCRFIYTYYRNACYISLLPPNWDWINKFNLFDYSQSYIVGVYENGKFEWGDNFIPILDILENKKYVTPEFYAISYYLYGINMRKDSERYEAMNKLLESILLDGIDYEKFNS